MAATAATGSQGTVTHGGHAQRASLTQRSRHICGAMLGASYRGLVAQPATFATTRVALTTAARHAAAPAPATATVVAAGGIHLINNYELELQKCNSSVLEQFAGLVPDYPKLVRALSLVACGELRCSATALIGLALLEEATQQPYDLISLE